MIETYYQAVGLIFGHCCLILGIWHGIRPAPIEPEQTTGFETVKYFEREVETVPAEKTKLETTINFEL